MKKNENWNALFAKYAQEYPELAGEFTRRANGELPANWKENLPIYPVNEPKAAATRDRSAEVLNHFANLCDELIGGSADLSPSNLTTLKCSSDFQKDTPAGRYIRFGVREHAMAAICNGMFAHGMVRPYCATFLNFIGYALGSVRVSALSGFGIIYVMTHDSIGLGEDGPTHQPVEMLTALRALPNLYTFRPADGNEVVGAYAVGIQSKTTPTVISLSRQGCPTLAGSSAEKTEKGGYTVCEYNAQASGIPALILVATGTEVHLAAKAAEEVAGNDLWVKVVSMPCTELFDAQPLEYQRSILVGGAPILSVEACGVAGWRGKYSHAAIGLHDCFGASAPGPALYEHFGLTLPNVVSRSKELMAHFAGKSAPDLLDYPRFPAILPPHPTHL